MNWIEELKGKFDHHALKLHERMSGIENQLAELVRSTEGIDLREEYNFKSVAGVADANGLLDIELGPPPVGTVWNVRQTGVTGLAAANSQVVVYYNQVTPQNVIDFSLVTNGINAWRSNYFVADGQKLIFEFTKQGAAGQFCTAGIQVRQYTLSADFGHAKGAGQ